MSQHQGQTDQVKKVQLPSAIHQVLWTKRMAAPGGKVGLEIFTHYVGNKSELKIEFTDQSGKTLGNYSDTMSGNRFAANITVPANAKDALYATAKLPKHGLSMKSGPLIILPPVQITNAKWDKQEARRGDILKLTADVKGVPDGTEAMIEIYEHDADGAHDFVTKFPVLVKNKKVEAEWEFEYHEDVDDIPTAEESERGYHPPEYFFRVKVGEVSAESGLVEFKDWIEINLTDDAGNPISNAEFALQLPDSNKKQGKLNADGHVRDESLLPGKIKITFPKTGPFTQYSANKSNIDSLKSKTKIASGCSYYFKLIPFRFSE